MSEDFDRGVNFGINQAISILNTAEVLGDQVAKKTNTIIIALRSYLKPVETHEPEEVGLSSLPVIKECNMTYWFGAERRICTLPKGHAYHDDSRPTSLCITTSDWGCEARRKLGIARGALVSTQQELSDFIGDELSNPARSLALDNLLVQVEKALIDSAQPDRCSNRGKV